MTQQQYAPQYPQAPQAPQPQQFQPPYPQAPAQPTYPPQQGYPAQAPQQFQPQYAPPPPAQPLAQGSLDDFYNQPSSGGGPSLKFEVIGTRYVGIVARPLGQGDVQQQTNTQGVALFFKDGRPKWVMKVPLQMEPSQQYPDGIAQWYVKGGTRDELARAMSEAGAPAGAPEAGAIIDVTFVNTRNAGVGMNPAKVFQVRYTRPQGSAPATAPPAQQPPSVPPQQVQAPVQQRAPLPEQPPAPQPTVDQTIAQQPAPPAWVPQGAPQQVPVQQQPVQQQPVQQQQQQQQAPQGALQPPAGLSPDQQVLLARITGQPQPQPQTAGQ